MARKISLVNYKGGVGKTSIAVNLCAALAARGRRVLLVDLDAQSNASIWLMRLDRWNVLNGNRSRSLFATFFHGGPSIGDCVVENVVQDGDGRPLLPGLDLVPTTFNLMDLEHEWKPDPHNPYWEAFHNQVVALEDRYDYIFFDCPPNVYRATQCGLYSSDEVYVPANPDALSLIGLSLFVEKAVRFHERSSSFRDETPAGPSKVCGVIYNSIKAGTNTQIPRDCMRARLELLKEKELVHPRAAILPHEIRDATIVRRAVSAGLPVILFSDKTEQIPVREDYINLAAHMDLTPMVRPEKVQRP